MAGPGATPVATPAVSWPLLMVAIPGLEDVHVTNSVRSWVSPLPKVPTALKPVWNPAATLEFWGEIAIDVSVAPSTKRLAEPLIAPSCAVIVTCPDDSPVTTPGWLIAATELFDDVHIANGFMFSCVLSVKVPSATYSCPEAGAIWAFAGVRLIDASVAEVTVSGALLVTLVAANENVALTVAFPALMPTANPGEF